MERDFNFMPDKRTPYMYALSIITNKTEVIIRGQVFIFGIDQNNFGIILFPNLLSAFTDIDLVGRSFDQFVDDYIVMVDELFDEDPDLVDMKAPMN